MSFSNTLSFSVLSSGSKANCIYLSGGSTRVLLDVGLGVRRTVERLIGIGSPLDGMDAIVISHEHHDHLAGIETILRHKRMPVFVAKEAYRASKRLRGLDKRLINFFEPDCSFAIGELIFQPFRIQHDAADPVAFRIQYANCAMAVVTDLGVVTDHVRNHLNNLQALVLESNHELDLLAACRYPEELKDRIRSDHGHLSNCAAGTLIEELFLGETFPEVLVAAHISENSNRPEVALARMERLLSRRWKDLEVERPTLIAASVYSASPLFELGRVGISPVSAVLKEPQLLSLFD